MNILLTALLLGASLLSASAQSSFIQNIPSRKTISLDGEWKSIIDPYNHGFYHRFQYDLKFDGTRLSDYDFDTSHTLRVPGDWNTQRPELMLYEGRIWYRTKFDSPLTAKLSSLNSKLYLHFGAANYIAQVWLNGKLLGTHEGGFTPFEFEITDKVKEKDNSLVVCVDDTRKPNGIPTLNTDWYNYGGLTRSVCLIEEPQRFVRDYCIKLSSQKDGVIDGYIQLNDSTPGQTVLIEIPALKIKQKLTTLTEGQAYIYAKAKPVLWTPEDPKLYDVIISYNGETIHDNIGFRTICTHGNKILLNNKEIFLCGVNIHEESLVDSNAVLCDKSHNNVSHRLVTRQEDSLLLAKAKELGCNFVRLAHYPHNEDMLRLADKMGLLVWSEIPLYWGIDWKNKHTYTLAEQQLEEMISRDHNRASIIIWSIANETAVNNERTTFLTNLADKARRLDDSRLITAALQNVNKRLSPTVYTVEDPLAGALDLFSYNEYIGWYDAPKEFCDSITWQLDTTKPVIISEFGGGAKHWDLTSALSQGEGKSTSHGLCDKSHNDNDVVQAVKGNPKAYFNEQNQVELYKHQFNMLRKIPGLAGTIPWVLIDFRSPHRLLEGVQDGYNRKGLYTEKGEKKPAWNIVKAWNDEHRK